MKRLLLSFTLVLATVLATVVPVAHARSETSPAMDDKQREIAALFTRWNAALGTGDAHQVAALYADDALLLPTKSSEARVTPEAREAYFRDFLKKYPGVKATIDADPARVIRVADRKATDTGHYTFTTADGAQVKARYTFVYRQEADGTWRISSHHSSALPE